jgi:tetraacyldisaccharide 4'-kinase
MKKVMKKMINWQRIWDDDGNKSFYILVKIILSILSFFYLIIINVRNWLYDHKIFKEVKLSCPVISVGNITAGGTGKTPCVIMLAQMLQRNGFKPAVISRGYGGQSISPANIVSDDDKILLDSEKAGDEPFLMANALKGVPVITGTKRIITGQTAIDKFATNILICDDAMQHRQIFRDINLVLLDSRMLQGNNHILPWGKLREPIKEIRRADAILLTRSNEGEQVDEKISELIKAEQIPVFRSIHQPQYIISSDESIQKPMSDLKGKKVCAFCGIANPHSFEKTILAAEAKILSFDIFPDHHNYSEKEIEKLKDGFIKSGADYLVTTEKDAVRLRNHLEFLKTIFILRIKMQIKPSEPLFENLIIEKLKLCRVQK